jgi:hypothetical protein
MIAVILMITLESDKCTQAHMFIEPRMFLPFLANIMRKF